MSDGIYRESLTLLQAQEWFKKMVISTGVPVALSALPVRYKAMALFLTGNSKISPPIP
jgi:hypothetical protein